MRDQLIDAVRKHLEGHVAKHKMNVEVYLQNPTGIGEHSDVVDAIEIELKSIADYQGQLDALNTFNNSRV